MMVDLISEGIRSTTAKERGDTHTYSSIEEQMPDMSNKQEGSRLWLENTVSIKGKSVI